MSDRSDRPTKRVKTTEYIQPTLSATMEVASESKCDKAGMDEVKKISEIKYSIMDTIRAGDLGSSIAQFLPVKDKMLLSASSHRWTNIVNHSASWNKSLTITTDEIIKMGDAQRSAILNRPELQSMKIQNTDVFNEPVVQMFDGWIKKGHRSNIRCLTVIECAYRGGAPQFVNNILTWAPHLQVLKITNRTSATAAGGDESTISDDTPFLHTLHVRGFLSILFLRPLIERIRTTLRTLDIELSSFKLKSYGFRRLISSIPLTSLSIELADQHIEEVTNFYGALGAPILESLHSTGVTMEPKHYHRFPNLRHAICEHSSEVKDAVQGIAKLDRLTILFSTTDTDDTPKMLALLSSKMEVPNRIRLELPVHGDGDERKADLDFIQQIATARGGKVVPISKHVYTIEH